MKHSKTSCIITASTDHPIDSLHIVHLSDEKNNNYFLPHSVRPKINKFFAILNNNNTHIRRRWFATLILLLHSEHNMYLMKNSYQIDTHIQTYKALVNHYNTISIHSTFKQTYTESHLQPNRTLEFMTSELT